MPHCLRTALAAACTTGLAMAQVSYYSAFLDGAQEVPANASTAAGYGIVRLEEPANTVRVFVHWFGIAAPTAAHLHLAPAGANGGVILGLAAGPQNTFTGSGVLNAANVTALKAAGTYLNVHSAAFPGGEIRGQVVPPTSTFFSARLTGANEVPANASAATGTAVAFLHQPDNRLVYMVDTTGLANVTAAHVHNGAVGVNGPVVFPLNGGGGVYGGVSGRLTTAQINTAMADGFYVNVHTAAFPGGEIRGQLRHDLGNHFTARMDGAQEVPPAATPGVGVAELSIGATGVASIVVSYGGLLGAPTASHIHLGAVGTNGGVAVPLTASGGQFVATFTPSTAQLTALRGGQWYVNVHSTLFPGGEIRGQLGPATLPTTYGPSCPGSNGNRPEIGARRFLGLGTSVDIDVYGGLPGTAAFLIYGLSRDATGGGVPLPAAFPAAGLNAPCFFLLDPLSSVLEFADARGQATHAWNLPFLPGLRGMTVLAQWVLLDAAANPAGFVGSNGLSMTVQ